MDGDCPFIDGRLLSNDGDCPFMDESFFSMVGGSSFLSGGCSSLNGGFSSLIEGCSSLDEDCFFAGGRSLSGNCSLCGSSSEGCVASFGGSNDGGNSVLVRLAASFSLHLSSMFFVETCNPTYDTIKLLNEYKKLHKNLKTTYLMTTSVPIMRNLIADKLNLRPYSGAFIWQLRIDIALSDLIQV